jgi:4-amino-4-deoxy-L-arabinose transferase-like glycosyltransferase
MAGRVKSSIEAIARRRAFVYVLVFAVIGLALLLIEHASFTAARVPLQVMMSATSGVFEIDGQRLSLDWKQRPTEILLIRPTATTREIQIDGSDNLNNFDQDPAYFARLASSPYYQFQAWMRDMPSYSDWSDLSAAVIMDGSASDVRHYGSDSALLALPTGATVTFSANLTRPETPTSLQFICDNIPCAELVVDRNERYVVARALATGTPQNEQRIYFPTQPWPFAAEVVNLIARILLWSLALVGLLSLLSLGLTWIASRQSIASFAAMLSERTGVLWRRIPARVWRIDRWDALALLIAGASFAATLTVALVQFHGEPHILDASAYYFQAKIFASGRLAAPAPSDLAAFQGPFMISGAGRWFAQYAPGTSAMLALGMIVGAPWIVEPLLGTLALWGIYRLGKLLYNGATGLLALVLGALSGFYIYLAASYLSHAVALFFAVYCLLFFVRFDKYRRGSDLALALAFACALFLTRELSGLVIGGATAAFVLFFNRRALVAERRRLLLGALLAVLALVVTANIYILYNYAQTGDPFTAPRAIFSPTDRYGFGQDIGFYGQHTLAAGLVILDQLLTALQTTLYGWPFYLTLALLPCVYLVRRRVTHWDVFFGAMLVLLLALQVGYFYHGIYLGPRYLYEALPFLLLLTARGATGLADALGRGARWAWTAVRRPITKRTATIAGRLVVAALLVALIACNTLYYLPRQAQLRANYSGLPYWEPVDVGAIYAFQQPRALVVTDDRGLYYYILFPLNDPNLAGSTIYAYAATSEDRATLQTEFPDRTIYVMQVGANGAVQFIAQPR